MEQYVVSAIVIVTQLAVGTTAICRPTFKLLVNNMSLQKAGFGWFRHNGQYMDTRLLHLRQIPRRSGETFTKIEKHVIDIVGPRIIEM
jgi:hypothetical protein